MSKFFTHVIAPIMLCIYFLYAAESFGATIYYDDGTVLTVPDDWVKIKRPHLCEVNPDHWLCQGWNPPPNPWPDCKEEPDHPKCRRQRDLLKEE